MNKTEFTHCTYVPYNTPWSVVCSFQATKHVQDQELLLYCNTNGFSRVVPSILESRGSCRPFKKTKSIPRFGLVCSFFELPNNPHEISGLVNNGHEVLLRFERGTVSPTLWLEATEMDACFCMERLSLSEACTLTLAVAGRGLMAALCPGRGGVPLMTIKREIRLLMLAALVPAAVLPRRAITTGSLSRHPS